MSQEPRASNVERARWREKARQVLAAHIGEIKYCRFFEPLSDRTTEQATGICVTPANVRLIPRDDDAYEWQYEPQRYYLFHKHISKHNLGACRELCREVGKTFRATLRADCNVGNLILYCHVF